MQGRLCQLYILISSCAGRGKSKIKRQITKQEEGTKDSHQTQLLVRGAALLSSPAIKEGNAEKGEGQKLSIDTTTRVEKWDHGDEGKIAFTICDDVHPNMLIGKREMRGI